MLKFKTGGSALSTLRSSLYDSILSSSFKNELGNVSHANKNAPSHLINRKSSFMYFL